MKLLNVHDGDSGLEGQFYFNLFGNNVDFLSSTKEITIDYIEKCVNYLNALPNSVIDLICDASIRYCNDCLDMIGEKLIKFRNKRDVLKIIRPSTLIIPRPQNGDEPIVHLELNCDWEKEHGMEWIVRMDKILYVGSFSLIDPWGDYSIKESWNFA